MLEGKFMLNLVAAAATITITYSVLSTQARPQSDYDEIFAVDGFAFDGPAEGLNPITFERTTRILSTSTETSTDLAAMDKCIMTCPITSEYNPICGTDGVVYTNSGQLGCAQRCGRDIKIANYGTCSSMGGRG